MSLSFIRGMVAAVNPCGFILLPTYLMYFLGLQGKLPGSQRASLTRALKVSAAVSSGFLAVFLVVGIISEAFTGWVVRNAKYATLPIGIALIVLGVAMFAGFKLPISTAASLGSGKRDNTVRSMFVFGVAYALASLGCTIGLFIATLFGTADREGYVQGVANIVVYGLGMALLVSALTVALAFANTSMLKLLRNGMQYVDRIAAFFVVLSGAYLLWYFYWVDIREEGDPITDWAARQQAEATQFLSNNWQSVAIVLAAVVGLAVAYVFIRRDPEPASTDPSDERVGA
jgi:cytochrome c biogenesis protein CcdA